MASCPVLNTFFNPTGNILSTVLPSTFRLASWSPSYHHHCSLLPSPRYPRMCLSPISRGFDVLPQTSSKGLRTMWAVLVRAIDPTSLVPIFYVNQIFMILSPECLVLKTLKKGICPHGVKGGPTRAVRITAARKQRNGNACNGLLFLHHLTPPSTQAYGTVLSAFMMNPLSSADPLCTPQTHLEGGVIHLLRTSKYNHFHN